MNSIAFKFNYDDYAIEMGTGNIFQTILEDYETLGVIGEEHNKLMCYQAATSRLIDNPLNVLVLSSFGAGKSTPATSKEVVRYSRQLTNSEIILEMKLASSFWAWMNLTPPGYWRCNANSVGVLLLFQAPFCLSIMIIPACNVPPNQQMCYRNSN